MIGVQAETDYTNLMPSAWTNSSGDFQGGRERYQAANYETGKIMYQSFTAPDAGIYEIKFYAVTSSTSGRGFDNKYGDNIARVYASAGSNKSTVAMTVINQTGCTLVQDANIRTLSIEAALGETIEYGIENIATGGNWYTIKALSAKMKTVAEIFQAQYDEAYAIWEHSTENEVGARATFKGYVDAQLVIYESKSYPVKGSGVKYDFTSKMNMAINAWECKQGNGPNQYEFTGATETYGNTTAGKVMYQTVTGLASGEYEIHFYAVANAANGGGVEGTKTTVYANDQEKEIDVIKQSSCTPSNYERTFTVMVTNGSIEYGFKNTVAAGNWYICKNVALYMTGAPDLSDYYDAIAGKLTTANGLKSSPMNSAVLAALQDAIDATEGYTDITVIGTLETMNDNLTTAITQANASKDVYTTLNAAITKVEGWTATTAAAGLRTKYNNGTYDDETTVNDIYAEYQAAEISALAADGSAVDWTSVILNASFETGDMTGWSAESRSDTGVKDQSNGTYSITSGDPVDGSKLFNSWGGTAENNVYQTIKNLPAGTYTLTALLAGFKGESLVLAAGTTTNNVVVAGDKTVGYTVDVKFTLDATGDVVIKASNTKGSENSDASFIKADNFKLYKGDVMTNDYTALNTAIEAAEANTLGFDKDEYAPYNNVEALSALSNAKAVDQEKKIAQPLLDGIVSNLTSATWTPNATDVDAVFNGSFSSDVEGDWGLTGWTTNAWGQQRNDLPANSGANTNYGYYNQSGSLQYGNAGVYTMPLKANTIYSLTFKYASFDNNNNNKGMTVSVLNGEEGMAAMNFDANSTLYNVADGFVTKTLVFATGTAGNYVLTLANSGNTVMTDVSITKAASQTLTFADDAAVPTYAPGTYPSVKITRTLTANRWATAVYPFAVSGVDNIAVLDSYDSGTGVIGFTTAAASTANEPFLMRSTEGTSEISLSDVEVAATVANPVATKSGASLKGVYASGQVPVSEGNDVRYVVSSNQLYKVDSDVKIKPFRAYFEFIGNKEARPVLRFDDTTAINAIEAAEAESGDLKDGKYIIDNKVVIVKNGVKYGANGQKLN